MTDIDTAQTAEFEPATSEAEIASPADYDSGWELADNSTPHNVVFEHEMGVTPSAIEIYFSADKQTVYPLTWRWGDAAGNPVTISATDKTIVLAIFAGAPLHGVWTPSAGWTKYNQGYFRVFASK
ncbi:MAG: hypothetical protein AAGE94_23080 [Acidobacteriota bacterium]